MTAAIAPRDTSQINATQAYPSRFPNGLPVAPVSVVAGIKIFAGTLVAYLISAGVAYACRPQDAGAVAIVGVAMKTIDMTTTPAPTGYAAQMDIAEGVMDFYNGAAADAVLATSVYADVYAIDDSTVSIDSAGGTRLRAGFAYGLVPAGFPNAGQVVIQVGAPNPKAVDPAAGPEPGAGTASMIGSARAVATSLAAYTGSGTGTLTASANGAIGAQDGVTLVAGDILLIPVGTVGASTVLAKDAGPWQVVSPGGAGKYQLTRPPWWMTNQAFRGGSEIVVGNEGTLFGDTEWFVDAPSTGNTVDTSACNVYPESVTQQITLAAGVLAVANVPIRSATKSNYEFTRTTGNNCSTTVQYNPVSIVAGALGTATVTVQAQVAAGTIQNTDTSVGLFTIINR